MEGSLDRKWWVLLAIGAGSFMTALDGSVANIVLPVLSSAFKSDVATVEWVVTVYLLVLSGLLLSFGRLGDLHPPGERARRLRPARPAVVLAAFARA